MIKFSLHPVCDVSHKWKDPIYSRDPPYGLCSEDINKFHTVEPESISSLFSLLDPCVAFQVAPRSCIDLVSDHCTSITIVASTQGPARRKVSSSSSSATERAQSLKETLDRDRGKEVRKSTYAQVELPFWQSNWFLALLLAMAAGFFALALFLYLGLELPNASPSSAMAAEGVEVTYGSVIKLMHERTKFRLHSHDVPYGSGSGQQSVTGFQGVDDSNSYWVVKPVPDTSAKQGDAITHGTVLRLQHMRSRKWLHSHLHASPISGNLEVSCFGSDQDSDTGDHWRLEIEGSGKTWKQDQKVRFKHVDTQGYLHSHDKKYTRIAGGQQEVCGVREKRADNVWLAGEGVYLPVNSSK
ncbi:Stromal cell-derived factor 2-like protein [Rhynchospora pubera]|uniref:Stromal cell-derived factor 2-like protein n=1 Tax=Rhynchospora pubera TaxID=906938 RepID=A0AAV8D8W9_9POAL|nr:Stromal cell-derived factor 2-like protein [Rhynchospora pubera]